VRFCQTLERMHYPPPLQRCFLLVALLCSLLHSQQQTPAVASSPAIEKSTLFYGIEWKLIRAGTATMQWSPVDDGYQGDLHIESAGLVSKLYKVNDRYVVRMNEDLCASSVLINAEEGSRRRETAITFTANKARYQEKDLIKKAAVLNKEIDVPSCVHDYIGGLRKMRSLKLEPGQSAQVPMSDGKKFAQVKVTAQEREQVKTPMGTFPTMRYEVELFNNVLVNRRARLNVWITDDARRLPVQFRVRLHVLIGTINLQLEKEERN
jgi:hypothetical protein